MGVVTVSERGCRCFCCCCRCRCRGVCRCRIRIVFLPWWLLQLAFFLLLLLLLSHIPILQYQKFAFTLVAFTLVLAKDILIQGPRRHILQDPLQRLHHLLFPRQVRLDLVSPRCILDTREGLFEGLKVRACISNVLINSLVSSHTPTHPLTNTHS